MAATFDIISAGFQSMKKGIAVAAVSILFILIVSVFALSRTPAVRITQPTSIKLTPAGASVVIHFENTGEEWNKLRKTKVIQELFASRGIRAFQYNFFMPLFRSYVPRMRFLPAPSRLLKFLSRDATLSITPGDKENKAILLVTQITIIQKIKFKALKLLLFLKGNIRTKMMGDVPAYEIKTASGKSFLYCVMGDYLFLSNRSETLNAAISNALNMTTAPLSGDMLFMKAYNTEEHSPAGLFRFYENASGKRTVDALYFTGKEQPKEEELAFATFTVSEKNLNASPDQKTYFSAVAPYLPKETVFFSHLDFTATLFHGESIKSLLTSETASGFSTEVLKLNLHETLLPLLAGSCMVTFSKTLTLPDGTPLPDFTFIFPLNPSLAQKTRQKSILSVIEKIFIKSLKDAYKKQTEMLYGTQVVSFVNAKRGNYATLSPSYAIIGGFLFVTLTLENLEKILAVKKGFLPCLQDTKDFKNAAPPQKAKFYFFTSGAKASGAVKDYLTQILEISSGFMEKEIKTGLLPASREIRRFSHITGTFVSTKENTMEGKVEFVFRKN